MTCTLISKRKIFKLTNLKVFKSLYYTLLIHKFTLKLKKVNTKCLEVETCLLSLISNQLINYPNLKFRSYRIV